MKIAILTLSVLLLISCKYKDVDPKNVSKNKSDVFAVELDSCEYVVFDGYKNGGIVHKQNCKYCEQRRK